MILPRMADKIQVGQPAFGLNTQFADPALLEICGADWDFVWIDLQHGMLGPNDLPGLIRGCDLVGLTALVRLPADRPDLVSFVLDLDAGGVIIAQVESVAQAQAMVAAAKFPSLGNRSFGGRRIIDRHGRDYFQMANAQQWLILQIESPEAAAICDSFAAIPGVDGLMIGPDDMKMRLGLPLSAPLDTPELARASSAVTAACRQHGKRAMGFAAPTPAGIQASVEAGFDLISVAAIARMIQQGSGDLLKVRQAWAG
jgi:2-keto-3-deoxy-L-rhamnonate aldolase RhmA